MKAYRMPTAEELRELRIINELTLAEVSRRSGVSTDSLRRWERGDYEPRLSDARTLLNIYESAADVQIFTDGGESRAIDVCERCERRPAEYQLFNRQMLEVCDSCVEHGDRVYVEVEGMTGYARVTEEGYNL